MVGRAKVVEGDLVAGRYRVEGMLGRGSMATVFRATHLGTGQACALKLVHSHLATRKEFLDLFLKEARVGARIGRNPHIVDVFDAGVDETRIIPFMAMELLQGETLDRHLRSHGALPPGLVRTLFVQLADALDQAHEAGVIHRDLKPSNLFLTRDRKGQPHLKVVDFGIAKVLDEAGQRTATEVGSPAYAAPEQLGPNVREMALERGITLASTVSPATDIWALGLVAYELLTGTQPGQLWETRDRRKNILEIVMAVAFEDPPPPSLRAGPAARHLPGGFDAWLARCLRKNPAERWPSAGAAIEQLLALLGDGEAPVLSMRRRGKGGTEVMLPPESIVPPVSVIPGLDTPLPGNPGSILPGSVLPGSVLPGSVVPGSAVPGSGTLVSPSANAGAYGHATLPDADRPTPILPPMALDALETDRRSPVEVLASPSRAASTLVRGALDTNDPLPLPPPPRRAAWLLAATATGALTLGLVLSLAILTRKGRLSVVVQGPGGATLETAQVLVDGKKRCELSPCVVTDLDPGTATVEVIAGGTTIGPIQGTVKRGEETTVMVSVSRTITNGN
ncbi:serine/threonine-protein kinase [Polyangium aurulentum]|uniref:serine/threonine-protein kinase n=1 Tax=Polyangium aurulentum TaxID=2567896 RepID=UPI0010AE893D|nr:serine/threonine-protein kinase [Polyangium aurulentum]UQA57647.1 protein kinase [Polyangium aurulentum]